MQVTVRMAVLTTPQPPASPKSAIASGGVALTSSFKEEILTGTLEKKQTSSSSMIEAEGWDKTPSEGTKNSETAPKRAEIAT